jgi:ATPase subunit of ABC transporter with duplicated ATPase domains
LDVNSRKWLANYLKNYEAGAMILVTHDVSLLQSVSHIAEIAGGTLETYKSCTYNQYLEEKQRRAEAAMTEYERNQAKAAKLQGFVDRFGASATKASAAQSRVKQLEKMKQRGLLDAPVTTHTTRFRPTLVLPDPPQAIGESLLSLKNAHVGWTSSPLVSNIDFDIQKGMKILLRGANGAGKSSIVAALRGNLDLLEGTRKENSQLRYDASVLDSTINVMVTSPHSPPPYSPLFQSRCLYTRLGTRTGSRCSCCGFGVGSCSRGRCEHYGTRCPKHHGEIRIK